MLPTVSGAEYTSMQSPVHLCLHIQRKGYIYAIHVEISSNYWRIPELHCHASSIPKLYGTTTLSHAYFDLLSLHALPFDQDTTDNRKSSHCRCDSECFD